ncbi:hypothetical protein F5144DRAFT_354715 [Chaetomium tenue]|uniref:Uncharacterized protein n=1 Tax=Chaetomium tenue TaxID=1854479 RepID=A0ACB7NXL4_9PEZI|nr:hypothetical protein F5144DRAFT_354715 [Chaetomium globosum]
MGFYSPPPPARPFSEDKATLLTSWWITTMCVFIIILRLIGRYVRVEALFAEDKVAAIALAPLLLRMAFVHPILLYGTNNVLVDDAHALTETEIYHRSIGSGLVLFSRILHPAILWLFKESTLAFFDSLVGTSGKHTYTRLLRYTRIFLIVSFIGICIATLAECHPFPLHWQVVPDPGGHCRQGYVYLIITTACNVITDLLLVALPVPVVLRSSISAGRKALLVLLFSLHLLTALVALYRVPDILRERSYQATRTMWASVEVLVATFAANALTIGTFMRDTGLKKRKFRYQPPEEDVVRSARRESRVVGKTVSWDDPVSEAEGGVVTEVVGNDASGLRETGGTGKPMLASHREGGRSTESLDSLIPRSRVGASTPSGMGVIKTTTIQITASPADDPSLRPGGGAVTASTRGRLRGSSIQLQHLRRLSDADAGL